MNGDPEMTAARTLKIAGQEDQPGRSEAVPDFAQTDRIPVRHYLWAGLDFMLDQDGQPVLLEANRSSHMLGEYMEYHGNDRPFERIAQRMNDRDGPPCLLWRAADPLPDADEDACWIGRHLSARLKREPLIALVEENQQPAELLRTRDGQLVRAGSLFRWWYGLPWCLERGGTLVINPNAVWVTVRDKAVLYDRLRGAQQFRCPWSCVVDDLGAIDRERELDPDRFASGYVLKPRVGWGGYGVQIFDGPVLPDAVSPGHLICERIRPVLRAGEYWDVRTFVMDGHYLGGVLHSSRSPVTNYHQGGRSGRLDPEIAERLRAATLEAVWRIDQAAEEIFRLPAPPESPLTRVQY